MQGAELFQSFCAPCHGSSGKGDGPVASALKDHTPDLTRLAAENGGTFPSARLKAVIRNENGPVAHGTAQMPVWGPLFQAVSGREDKNPSKLKVIKESGISNPAIAELRVSNLIDYIQSLQVGTVK